MADENQSKNTKHDISIIRPEMRDEDFKLRGEGLSSDQLKTVKKGLLTLHTLELMAMTIYKFQLTSERSELNRQLIAAMSQRVEPPTHCGDVQ
ncbi:MAG: hypothetical protein ACYTER_12175 [Planctomycetota bacterium]|jgi:ubiquinone biosynthesis monooxygenase Coq7